MLTSNVNLQFVALVRLEFVSMKNVNHPIRLGVRAHAVEETNPRDRPPQLPGRSAQALLERGGNMHWDHVTRSVASSPGV